MKKVLCCYSVVNPFLSTSGQIRYLCQLLKLELNWRLDHDRDVSLTGNICTGAVARSRIVCANLDGSRRSAICARFEGLQIAWRRRGSAKQVPVFAVVGDCMS